MLIFRVNLSSLTCLGRVSRFSLIFHCFIDEEKNIHRRGNEYEEKAHENNNGKQKSHQQHNILKEETRATQKNTETSLQACHPAKV